MCKFKIKNFGPIGEGYTENDEFMDFTPITLICGIQGSGKSTLAKLYSTFVWMEKALMRKDITEKYIQQYNRFTQKILAYQNIQSYLQNNTLLHYKGTCFDFQYNNGKLQVFEHTDMLKYLRPQITYFPAERNLLSAIANLSNVKGIPEALQTLSEKFNEACRSLTGNLQLPINNVSFNYDRLNKISHIIGLHYDVRLSEASSGFQSLSPMFVTLNYLYEKVIQGLHQDKEQKTTQEKEIIKKRIEEILLNDALDSETRATLIKKISNPQNQCLINIIEEPEQNLYPDSQEQLLYSLLQLSGKENNQLVLTTHSPYILNFLSLSAKAYSITPFITKEEDKAKLDKIVPENSRINGDTIVVYQLDSKGEIHKLPMYDKMPSDDNLLNQLLAQTNTKFSDLIDLECQYEYEYQ